MGNETFNTDALSALENMAGRVPHTIGPDPNF